MFAKLRRRWRRSTCLEDLVRRFPDALQGGSGGSRRWYVRFEDFIVRIGQTMVPNTSGPDDTYLEFRLHWPIVGFQIVIEPESFGAPPRPGLHRLNATQYEHRQFVVTTNDAELAARFVTPRVRERINGMYRLWQSHEVYLSVSGRVFLVRKLGPIYFYDRDEFEDVVRSVVLVYQSALDGIQGDILWQREQPEVTVDGAFCEVCGEYLLDDVVSCQGCKTPYHRECWDYVGMCSIYGCGEKACVTPFRKTPVPRLFSLLRPKRIPGKRRSSREILGR